MFCSSDWPFICYSSSWRFFRHQTSNQYINCHAQSDQFLRSAIQQYGKTDNVLHFEASCLVIRSRMVTVHHLLFPEDERSKSF